MDNITIRELIEWRGAGRSFSLIDVRRKAVRDAGGEIVAIDPTLRT